MHETQDKIKAWEDEIESYGGKDIYFEESEGKQFVMLTQRINEFRSFTRGRGGGTTITSESVLHSITSSWCG